MAKRRLLWLTLIAGLGMNGCSADNEQAGEASALSPATSNGASAPAKDSSVTSPAGAMTAAPVAMPARPSSSGGVAAPGMPSPAPTTPGGSAPPGMAPSSGPAGGSSDPAPASAAAGGGAKGGAGSGAPDPSIQSGLLTAGTWDDNRNFDRFQRYRARLLQAGLAGAMDTTDKEHEAARDRFAEPRESRQQLDVSMVIDTTGSMGDEISYLQTEFLALSRSIEELYPDSEQRWSLVVYRDQGDQYVTRHFDFQDPTAFREQLAAQAADGGGDFPEAPEAALKAMTQLDWREGADVARLAFWLADAPHHEQNAQAMVDAIRDTADLDVHIYPVASSGIDDLTELTMRSSAQLSGGRYLFLTDDSGVGGEHKEPTIPCYFVTRLDTAILRMVSIELSGQYHEPTAEETIRTGGDPKNGRCKLDSGEDVQSF